MTGQQKLTFWNVNSYEFFQPILGLHDIRKDHFNFACHVMWGEREREQWMSKVCYGSPVSSK